MFEFPYIESYKKLEDVLNAVRSDEVPSKFTYRYLAKIGFPSSKDRDFVPAFRLMGLVDIMGRPTRKYVDLRDIQNTNAVIEELIDITYEKLFNTDPSAVSVSENVLVGYFGKLTGKSYQQSNVYAKTFLELVRLSGIKDFAPERRKIKAEIGSEEVVLDKDQKKAPKTVGTRGQSINLNINLPTTTDGKVYEMLFKHLKDLLTLE